MTLLHNLNWRERLAALVSRYDYIYFYSADPGASATLRPIYDMAKKTGVAAGWYVEGWAAHAYLPDAIYIARKDDFLNLDRSKIRQAVFMGQQVNQARAYKNLVYFKNLGLETVFISDHWKDISAHFKTAGREGFVLPDHFYVPDQVAYDVQFKTLLSAGIARDELEKSMEIFVHPGLEQSLEKIHAVSENEKIVMRRKYGAHEKIIVMMLDCIQDHEKELYGFNWKTALDQAVSYFHAHYPKAVLLVKPHPRQDHEEVRAYLQKYAEGSSVIMVEESTGEIFVALADEVWGITTILLVVAQKAAKPIKVFMPARTAAGELESNAHIEPFVVK